MIEYKMNRPEQYNEASHMDIGTFNDSYMKNKGVWPQELTPAKRQGSKRVLSTSGRRQKSPHASRMISSPGSDGAELNDFMS
jgi:hypothetical protein